MNSHQIIVVKCYYYFPEYCNYHFQECGNFDSFPRLYD